MKGKNEGSEQEARRRKRLETLSKEEWEEGVRNFWRWFERVRSWEEAKKPTDHRLSRN